MLQWLGKNIQTFLLALILAIGVWFAAVNETDPNEVLTYPAPIQIEIVGQNTDLLITNNYSTQIELTLSAPRSIWAQLTADDDSIHAMIDLSGYGVGEHTITPQVQIGLQPVKIISVTPSSLTINLEELVTTTFPIDLSVVGEPSAGYQAGGISYTPNEITISGAKSLVERVVSVQADFDMTDVRKSIDETLSLQILDEFDQDVNGITVSANDIQLLIPISQQGGYRDVAVKVRVDGQVANLHRLTNISVFPPVVTIYSDEAELVNELPGVVETETLDITGISEDISTRLQLTLPENILVVGDPTVLVTASVEALLGSQTISEKPLEIINLAPGLSVELSAQTVDVIISGPLPALNALTDTDLRVFVDLDGLEIGSHQLSISYEILNDDIQIESLLPENIEVVLSEAPEETPTPPLSE